MSTTGQWVGAIAGGVIGFFVTAGNPYGAVKGAAYGAALGGYIDPPPGPNLRGPTLDDKSFQSSAYGVSLATLHGTIATMGNIIYLENNEYKAVTKKESQGGKGGGGGTYETTTYFATFAVALGEAAEGSALRRIWAGGKLIYSIYPEEAPQSFTGAEWFKYYDGSQVFADSRMESVLGVGNCPSYEGTAYIIFYDFDLTTYGNGLAGCPIKVELVSSPGDVDWRVVYQSRSVMPPNLPPASGLPQYYEYPLCMFPAGGTGYSSFAHCALPSEFTDLDRTQLRLPDGRKELTMGVLSCRVLDFAVAITDTPSSYYHYNYIEGDPFLGEPLVRKAGVLKNGVDKLENGFKSYPLAYSQPYAIVQKVFDGHGETELFLMRATGADWDGDSPGEPAGSWFLASSGAKTIYHNFYFYDDDFGILAVGGGIVARIRWVSANDYRVYIYNIGSAVEVKSFVITLPGVTASFDYTTSAYFKYGKIYVMATRGADLNNGIIRLLIIDYVSESFSLSEVEIDELPSAQPLTFFNVIDEKTISVSVMPQFLTVDVYVISNSGAAENSTVLVRDICANEFDKVGVYSGFRDFSQLTDDVEVIGYRVSDPSSARAALSQLQARFLFDFVELGYKIHAVMREKSIEEFIDIDYKKLCLVSENVTIKNSYESIYQLPSSYLLSYLDIGREYDQNVQPAHYPANHQNIRNESLSIVMTPEEAATVAEKLLNLSWVESKKYQIKLPQIYLGVRESNHLRLEVKPGVFSFLRVDSCDSNSDQTMNLQCTHASPDVYSLASLGASGEVLPGTNVSVVYDTSSILLDVPMVVDSQDAPGFVAAPYGGGDGWRGAVLMRSDDGGQRYNGQARFFGVGLVGQAANVIAANDGLVIDRVSELLVWSVSGIAFESITESSMMTGKNYLAYGKPGRWEICCYAASELQSEGYYLLSTLIRGMRGTEWATGLHEIGDYVVLLDDTDNAFVGADLASIGVNKKYKTVTVGQDVSLVAEKNFVYSAANLKALSPVNPVVFKVANDWHVSASERSRYSSSFWYSGLQPVRDEMSYSMVIYNSAGIAVRTINNVQLSFIYTSAQQVADFGINQTTLTFEIYQNSASVGAGFPLRVVA